ncbi:uncharacterized protein KZ484_003257 [Pholidichthys leucotaenia]
MAQRVFHESGPDGRSVLGMLAVQVEKDPKTGATAVRSVAPMSTPDGAPKATVVFDDGRRSIRTIGRSAGQPSTEELGHILSVIDGVGMKILLDEVEVTPNKTETKTDNVGASRGPTENIQSLTSCSIPLKEHNRQLDRFRSTHLEKNVSVGNTGNITMTQGRKDAEKMEVIADEMLEEGPVTLMFMGYTDAEQGCSQEDMDSMITVERVIITEDGEEHVLGPDMPVSHQSPLEQKVEQESGKQSQEEVFRDTPLGGSGGAAVNVQEEEGDVGPLNPSTPNTDTIKNTAGAEGTTKAKTCQCCSPM